MRKLLLVVAIALATVSTTHDAHAAGWRIKLKYDPPEDVVLPSDAKSLAVRTRIDRPEAEGGTSVERVGTVRGGYGNPFDANLHKKVPKLDELLQTWAADTVRKGGFAATDASSSGPWVEMVLERFWFDGYMAYEVKMEVRVDLHVPGKTEPVWSKTFDGDQTGAALWSPAQISEPMNGVLTRVGDEIAEALRSSDFTKRVR